MATRRRAWRGSCLPTSILSKRICEPPRISQNLISIFEAMSQTHMVEVRLVLGRQLGIKLWKESYAYKLLCDEGGVAHLRAPCAYGCSDSNILPLGALLGLPAPVSYLTPANLGLASSFTTGGDHTCSPCVSQPR